MISLPYKWLAFAFVALAILAGVGYECDQHGRSVIQAAWDKERASIAEAGATAQRQAAEKHETQETAVAASDINRTQEKSNALAEIDSHRALVAAGTERVRIVAQCPAGGGDLPQAAGAASVVHGTSVELDPANGQTVLDLRAAIVADQVKIKALQDYVEAVQK